MQLWVELQGGSSLGALLVITGVWEPFRIVRMVTSSGEIWDADITEMLFSQAASS